MSPGGREVLQAIVPDSPLQAAYILAAYRYYLNIQILTVFFSNLALTERGLPAKALNGSSSSVGDFGRLLFWL